MADISAIITRKSLKAKQKAAIRTVKAQAKEKIEKLKKTPFDGEDDEPSLSREEKRALRSERRALPIQPRCPASTRSARTSSTP